MDHEIRLEIETRKRNIILKKKNSEVGRQVALQIANQATEVKIRRAGVGGAGAGTE